MPALLMPPPLPPSTELLRSWSCSIVNVPSVIDAAAAPAVAVLLSIVELVIVNVPRLLMPPPTVR